MEFHYFQGNLFLRLEGKEFPIDINGGGEINEGQYSIVYQYRNGLPVLSAISYGDHFEACEFQDGLLRSFYTEGITYHYLYNVYLTETRLGESKDVIIRERPRCRIKHEENKVEYVTIDDNFLWLLERNPSYVNKPIPKAPFSYQGYLEFYKQKVKPQEKERKRQAYWGSFHVNWSTVDNFIDGFITATRGDAVVYKAIVTKNILEKESVLNFDYLYSRGKVLVKIIIDGNSQELVNGVLIKDPYNKGYIKGQERDKFQLRPNIPYTDPEDSIRSAIREVLPLSIFD